MAIGQEKIGIQMSAKSRELLKKLGDVDLDRFTEALEGIGRDYRKNMAVRLSSPGTRRWQDLKESYKKQKMRKYGRVYPILVASGELKKSLSEESHSDNVSKVSKSSARFGTKLHYAKYHETGAPKNNMPARPFVYPDDARVNRWRRIIENYYIKLFQRAGIDIKGGVLS